MTAPDIILVGGGLANGLLARRLRMHRPEVTLLVLEASDRIGGEHTWSFHDTDLLPREREWIEPLVVRHWRGQSVRFPSQSRVLSGGYASITSDRFRQVIAADIGGDNIRLRTPVRALTPTTATLADGTMLTAKAVIDGRGPVATPHMAFGHQVFVGHVFRLSHPHGLDRPVIMDATVPQTDGYRFIYLLPFAPEVLLVEDTGYVASEAREKHDYTYDYVDQQGWEPIDTLRSEVGDLPITLSGDIDAFWKEAAGVPKLGAAGGFFHPTTGYSLPDAVRTADLIAHLPTLDAAAIFAALEAHAKAQWRRQGFYRALNRMLFLAAKPAGRRPIFARFYALPEPLIARFYAGRSTLGDKIRILAGRPPIPVGPALRALAATVHSRSH
ncbi:lycopene beta-cyclase CrtY [Chthonobacter albigriseus]|uniref:lycopene beta-cyclase CrtY n=1 Tax=Chthonobacter albigriseus TaxID=1683161 RepID=UPI0015EED647